jgi:hypothetical protein
MKSSQKEQKRIRLKKGEIRLDCVAPDSLVCTRQFGAWSVVLDALRNFSLRQL